MAEFLDILYLLLTRANRQAFECGIHCDESATIGDRKTNLVRLKLCDGLARLARVLDLVGS